MFDVRALVLVDQAALGTSFETHFENMLSESDANMLLEDTLESIYTDDPLMFEDFWRETPLYDLPSELAIHARALDPTADPVALGREARSALTEALPHIIETYKGLADHSVTDSMQRDLHDAILAELEEGAEPVPPRLTDLCRPRAMVASANAERV